ncbi:MAG: hypothetical protein JNL67_20300 [Planctomycetaceae bacterium]|nr:hypothetical protein [Planctomycetaceae bacterium]
MSKGKVIPLSNGRRLVDDVIRIARSQPIASFYRDVDVSAVDKLRKQIKPKLSWNAIMMKAFALVSEQVPELRQFYRKFPWPHLYQVEESVAQLTVGREDDGEVRLYFARFRNPHHLSLHQIQEKIDYFQTAPISEIKQFRHQDRFAALPGPLRRFLWWSLMEAWPTQRPTYMGTFGMTLSGFNNTFASSLLSPNTTSLGVDPTPRNGIARILLTFDHRVLDGKPTIDIISKLYSTLVGPVQQEMERLIAEKTPLPESPSVAA